MNDIYSEITKQFNFLKDFGLVFNYAESQGKLGDRHIQKFTYENINLRKKFEIVSCKTDFNSRLHSYLVKTDGKNKNQLDPKKFIPFERLRCFFEEGGDIIFFGNAQDEFSYKLKEFKLVAEKFLACLTSNDWIDYEALLRNEMRIYFITLEPKNNYIWADQIKENDFIKTQMTVTYDASLEPPYEAHGLKLKSKNNIEFHITHGWKSIDDDAFAIQVTDANKKTQNHELLNVGSVEVIEFIERMVST